MEAKQRKKRKAVVDAGTCVACLGAISVWRGIAAKVDPERCVGCGKCARECPASVISIQEVTA